MQYHNDELTAADRCFDVTAELSGADWEKPDRSVGIMRGGFCGVTVDSLTAREIYDDGQRGPLVTDQETIAAIAERVKELAEADPNVMDDLSDQHESDRAEARSSRFDRMD